MQQIDRIAIKNQLLDKARTGKRPTGLLIGMPSTDVVEIAASMGFDWLLIDTEHTTISTPAQLLAMIRTAELYRVPTLVKLATWEQVRATDALDAGAFGIQVPFVDNLEILNEVIKAVRFKPAGTRGFCPAARAAGFEVNHASYDAFFAYQKQALIMPLIESKEALANIDDMLANSPDVPIFTIGAEDMRLSLGVDPDPKGRAYMRKIVQELSHKMAAAGKIVCLPYEPLADRTAAEAARDFDTMHNDMPYTGDTICLAFGIAESLRARDAGVK